MKRFIGFLGILISVVCVIVGFVWSVRIIVDQWGVSMGGIAVLAFPATLTLMPWYAGFVLGNWWLLALIWGGGFVGGLGQDLVKN